MTCIKIVLGQTLLCEFTTHKTSNDFLLPILKSQRLLRHFSLATANLLPPHSAFYKFTFYLSTVYPLYMKARNTSVF